MSASIAVVSRTSLSLVTLWYDAWSINAIEPMMGSRSRSGGACHAESRSAKNDSVPGTGGSQGVEEVAGLEARDDVPRTGEWGRISADFFEGLPTSDVLVEDVGGLGMRSPGLGGFPICVEDHYSSTVSLGDFAWRPSTGQIFTDRLHGVGDEPAEAMVQANLAETRLDARQADGFQVPDEHRSERRDKTWRPRR